jgi:hypothetical protein
MISNISVVQKRFHICPASVAAAAAGERDWPKKHYFTFIYLYGIQQPTIPSLFKS